MVLTVKEDSDGMYLEFPDELVKELGWELGDTIRWTELDDGTWQLEKVNES